MTKVQSSRDNAELFGFLKITEHGVRFAWASLPIGKYGGIPAFEEVFDMSGGDSFEKILLRSVLPEDAIERIAIFPVVNHIVVVFILVGLFSGWPKSTKYLNTMNLFLLLLLLEWLLSMRRDFLWQDWTWVFFQWLLLAWL